MVHEEALPQGLSQGCRPLVIRRTEETMMPLALKGDSDLKPPQRQPQHGQRPMNGALGEKHWRGQLQEG